MTTVEESMTDRRIAWIALGSLAEPGNRELGRLVRAIGPVRTVERACAGRLSETLTGAMTARLGGTLTPESITRHTARLTTEADRLGTRIACPDDADWPLSLADLARISRVHTGAPVDRDADPPLTLWARGALPLAATLHRSVAIVGARAATSYGEFVAGDLAHALATNDWTVVSGGALGIDAAAHRAALRAGGHTVAVLACGIDRPYPVSNTGLLEQIGESGLLLTEWPPGSPPHRVRFLVRNRVIAAVSTGTIVVEAARRSGSRQTLHRAAQLGRIPMVVPGPVTSAMSVGCHEELRREYTRAVATPEDVLEEVGRIGEDLAPMDFGQERPHDALDPVSAQVLEGVLPRKARGAEEVAAAAGVSGRAARRALPLLVATGFVVPAGDGYRLAQAPRATMPPADRTTGPDHAPDPP